MLRGRKNYSRDQRTQVVGEGFQSFFVSHPCPNLTWEYGKVPDMDEDSCAA